MAVAGAVRAQDGYFDPTWAAGGRLLVDVSPLDDLGTALVIQPDGKLVLAGYCTGVQAQSICAARLRSNGQPDLSFGPNETGRVRLSEQPGFPTYSRLGWHGLALLPDARIVLAGTGQFGFGGGISGDAGMLVRLGAAGHPEPAPAFRTVEFSVHGDANQRHNAIHAVVVAPDGKIVVVGESVRAGSTPSNRDFGIARFNADLSPDAGFSGSGVRLGAFDLGGDYLDIARDAVVQPDGRIVAAGYARGADGLYKAALLRLNVNGSADASFGNGGRLWFDGLPSHAGTFFINAVTLDRQGRILAAGARQVGQSGDFDFFVARVTGQGQLDPTFNGGGFSLIPFDLGGSNVDEAWDLAVQGDGRILVTGSVVYSGTTNQQFAVARLDPNGLLDESFGIAGRSIGTFAPPGQAAAVDDNGHASALGNGGLMVAGHGRAQGGDSRFGIAKLQLDAIFRHGFQP